MGCDGGRLLFSCHGLQLFLLLAFYCDLWYVIIREPVAVQDPFFEGRDGVSTLFLCHFPQIGKTLESIQKMWYIIGMELVVSAIVSEMRLGIVSALFFWHFQPCRLLPLLIHIPLDSRAVFLPGLPRQIGPGQSLHHRKPQISQIPPTLSAGDTAAAGQLPVFLRRKRIEWA